MLLALQFLSSLCSLFCAYLYLYPSLPCPHAQRVPVLFLISLASFFNPFELSPRLFMCVGFWAPPHLAMFRSLKFGNKQIGTLAELRKRW